MTKMWSLICKIITCCTVFLLAGRAGHALKTDCPCVDVGQMDGTDVKLSLYSDSD